MWPDRVSNPGPDLRVRCPTDCATRPGSPNEKLAINACGQIEMLSSDGRSLMLHVSDKAYNAYCTRQHVLMA